MCRLPEPCLPSSSPCFSPCQPSFELGQFCKVKSSPCAIIFGPAAPQPRSQGPSRVRRPRSMVWLLRPYATWRYTLVILKQEPIARCHRQGFRLNRKWEGCHATPICSRSSKIHVTCYPSATDCRRFCDSSSDISALRILYYSSVFVVRNLD